MYEIFNANRVQVDVVHAKDASHALADFLSRSVGNPGWVRRRREWVLDNATPLDGMACCAGVLAIPREQETDPCDCGTVFGPSGMYLNHAAGDHPDCTA
jgi:hypothetical protein